MPNYKVYLSGYFSEGFDIEAEDEQEAAELGQQEFLDTYQVVGPWGMSWDDVIVDSVESEDEDDGDDND